MACRQRRFARVGSGSVALGLLLFALPLVSSAQTEPQAESTDHLDEANRYYQAGDFVHAGTEFVAAYQATSDYRLFLRIADCHLGLGHRASAMRALLQYLTGGACALASGERSAAESRIAELAPFVGALDVRSSPSLANVAVDREVLGPTPLASVHIEVPHGALVGSDVRLVGRAWRLARLSPRGGDPPCPGLH